MDGSDCFEGSVDLVEAVITYLAEHAARAEKPLLLVSFGLIGR